MSNFLKWLITGTVLLSVGYLLFTIVKVCIDGDYLNNASFITSVLIFAGIVSGLYFVSKGLRSLWKLSLILLSVSFILSGCNYAKSNQQVLSSTDCGMTWKRVESGEAVAKGVGNPCHINVVIPNYPMQGSTSFVSNLKGKVRVLVTNDYDYEIFDGLLFINKAKFLGKGNADPDSKEALDDKAFESAENIVIDVTIKEIAKRILASEDIIDMDQAEIEKMIEMQVNDVLAKRGVKLNSFTLTFENEPQTSEAIDVCTAMKIYESKGLSDLGKQIMIAKAGANKTTVVNNITPSEAKIEE